MKNRLSMMLMAFGLLTGFRPAVLCNSAQSLCTVVSKNFTLGDKVGIFAKSGELIAEGEVKRLDRSRRIIKIDKKHSKIMNRHKVALLSSEKVHYGTASHKVASFKKHYAHWGASAGYTNLAVGLELAAFEANGVYENRWLDDWKYVFRGSVLSGSGSGAIDTVEGKETVGIDIFGLGALGGIARTFLTQNAFSLRTELSLGAMYTQFEVANSTKKATESISGINSGISPYSKLLASVLWNRENFKITFDLAYGYYHSATASGVAMGIIYPI